MLMTIFGKRGSGKTTLIRALIPKLKKPVVIIDILGNYGEVPGAQCQSHVEGLQALLAYTDDPKNNAGVIIIQDADVDRCADYICSALWARHGGTLVVDEADIISEPDCPCFNETIRYGRNRGIDVITGCRRPAEISRNVTAGADIAYCLSTQEPRDIDYYRDFLGEREAMQLMRTPPHHGVYKDFVNQKSGTFSADKTGKIKILTSVSFVNKPEQMTLTPTDPQEDSKDTPLESHGSDKPPRNALSKRSPPKQPT